MIRINLLPTKRNRQADAGQQSLLAGFLVVIVAAAAVFFLVHRPLVSEIDELQTKTKRITRDNKQKEKQLKGFKELKAAVANAKERKKVITRLNKARATPAHLLHELSLVLTSKRSPTMTKAMSKQVRENPNRELSPEWDAKHVWITRFTETGGNFRLEGAAQSDTDMTQFAKRLQASVYFHDIIPQGGTEAVDKESGISYYKFTITGKVAY